MGFKPRGDRSGFYFKRSLATVFRLDLREEMIVKVKPSIVVACQ